MEKERRQVAQSHQTRLQTLQAEYLNSRLLLLNILVGILLYSGIQPGLRVIQPPSSAFPDDASVESLSSLPTQLQTRD